jgi:hypothetical protein
MAWKAGAAAAVVVVAYFDLEPGMRRWGEMAAARQGIQYQRSIDLA